MKSYNNRGQVNTLSNPDGASGISAITTCNEFASPMRSKGGGAWGTVCE